MGAGGDRVRLVGRSLKHQPFLSHTDTDLLLGHPCSLKQIWNKSPSYSSVLFLSELISRTQFRHGTFAGLTVSCLTINIGHNLYYIEYNLVRDWPLGRSDYRKNLL